jgi:hypothetical protein
MFPRLSRLTWTPRWPRLARHSMRDRGHEWRRPPSAGTGRIIREPTGVVAAIAPWNAPVGNTSIELGTPRRQVCGFRLMLMLDQGPDHLAVVHVPIALVDVFQLVALGHQLV